jgi:hypothetical protein
MVICGSVGGLGVVVFEWLEDLRRPPGAKAKIIGKYYLAAAIIKGLGGAFAVLIYLRTNVRIDNLVLATQLGASAPLLFRQAAALAPTSHQEK